MIVTSCFEKSKNKSLPLITAAVIILHGVLLFMMTFQTAEKHFQKKNQNKVLVKTITLQPKEVEIATVIETLVEPQQELVAAEPEIEKQPEIEKILEPEMVEPKIEITEAIKKSEPVKKVEPVKKIEPIIEPIKKPLPVKKVEPIRKVEPVKKPELKKVDPIKKVEPIRKVEPTKKVDPKIAEMQAKKKELLASVSKNLEKVKPTSTSSLKKENATLAKIKPLALGSLSVDAEILNDGKDSFNVREVSYRNELASRLKNVLKLPENGEVKIKLTIGSTGKFINLIVTGFESKKNRKYIEEAIKKLTFPSFSGNFNNATEYTFSITLK